MPTDAKWNPTTKQRVNRRKRYPFTHAHQDPGHEQGNHATGRRDWREQREQGPEHHPKTQHDLAAVAFSQPAARNLSEQVPNEERRKHTALLFRAPVEIGRHRDDRNGHDHPVHVADEHGNRSQQHDRVPCGPAVRSSGTHPFTHSLLVARRGTSILAQCPICLLLADGGYRGDLDEPSRVRLGA